MRLPYGTLLALSAGAASPDLSRAAPLGRRLQEGSEPNPPEWPASVRVFKPTDTDVEEVVGAAFATNGGMCTGAAGDDCPPGQWSDARFAFLFEPGMYASDVPVGFYTTVAGLGKHPNDVVFTGDKGVYTEEGDSNYTVGSLDQFWRTAENFRTQATHMWQGAKQGMLWSVSQASPLRSVHVDYDLQLYEYEPPYKGAGYSSGGFLANSKVGRQVHLGSQQQWFFRNSDLSNFDPLGGVFNFVFVGVLGAPESHCNPVWTTNMFPFHTTEYTPTVAEKPFIIIDPDSGKYSLEIPQPKTNSSGTSWDTDTDNTVSVSFENVYVAKNASDTAASINAKLAAGLHLVLTPGIYGLDAPLQVTQKGQVVLGLGLATLVPTAGTPAIKVAAVDGVRVAGLLIQAGEEESPTLLHWGDEGYAGDATDPGVISDVFVRVGGPEPPDVAEKKAKIAVHIASSHVIIDNAWIWRADHTLGGDVKDSKNPSQNGLVVKGDHVTTYGLSVEHFLQDNTVWLGEQGAMYFYQCELPYDVTQEEYCPSDSCYAGLRIDDAVTSFFGAGIGVYHFFADHKVNVTSGVVAPDALVPSIETVLSIYLNGIGWMQHPINSLGDPTPGISAGGEPGEGVPGAHTTYYCNGITPPPPPPPPPAPGPPAPTPGPSPGPSPPPGPHPHPNCQPGLNPPQYCPGGVPCPNCGKPPCRCP